LDKPSDLVVIGTLVAGAAAATAFDLRTRRVPNALNALLALCGVGYAVVGIGHLSIAAALVGSLIGLVLMLPGHLFGATGAGDVKLFAAMGALLGPAPIVGAFLYTALAGGLLAVVVALRRGRLQRTFDGAARLVATRGSAAAEIERPDQNNRFCYAPAIAVGAIVAAIRL
jgi:prepilin peptidase CpaA